MAAVHVKVVIAPLARRQWSLGVDAGEAGFQLNGRLTAGQVAAFVLLFLVAVDVIFQEMGEVVPEGLAAADVIGAGGEAPVAAFPGVVAGNTEAFRSVAIAGIKRAVAADQPLLHRAHRLVGDEIAVALVIHHRQIVAVGGVALAVAGDSGVFAKVVAGIEGPIHLAGRRTPPSDDRPSRTYASRRDSLHNRRRCRRWRIFG